MPTRDELKMFQAYPLDMKIRKTQLRIKEWVDYYCMDGVYVSFSGGKDSTVLLDIVRKMYPTIEAVFVNTGLEYPEIQSFVKSFDNVTILRPKMRFDEVIRKYGYPFIGKKQADTISGARISLRKGMYSLRLMECGVSIDEAKEMGLELPSEEMLNRYIASCDNSKYVMKKYKPLLFVDFEISHYCCNVMKKKPMHDFQKLTGKLPITAQTAEESMLREAAWLKNGCNAFNAKHKISNPMSFWTEQDILKYIVRRQIEYHNCVKNAIYGGAETWEQIEKFSNESGVKKFEIASVYGDIDIINDNDGFEYAQTLCNCGGKFCTTGCARTGCIFCGFGAHREKGESRFERLKKTHPRQYEYCMGGGAYDTDGLWKPTKDGLGMAHCIDELNKIYGKDFIRY